MIEKGLVCCPDGWHQIFHSSRFCTNAEHKYAPIEGEAAVMAWALEKCMFVMSFPSIIVVTDHEPLKRLFGARYPSKIQNPWLFRLKEKKSYRGSDAISCNPVDMLQALLNVFPAQLSQSDIPESGDISNMVESTSLTATFGGSDNIAITLPDLICAAGYSDPQCRQLISMAQQGFPKTCHLTAPKLHNCREVKHRFSTGNCSMLDWRIVIKSSEWKKYWATCIQHTRAWSVWKPMPMSLLALDECLNP